MYTTAMEKAFSLIRNTPFDANFPQRSKLSHLFTFTLKQVTFK